MNPLIVVLGLDERVLHHHQHFCCVFLAPVLLIKIILLGVAHFLIIAKEMLILALTVKANCPVPPPKSDNFLDKVLFQIFLCMLAIEP